VLEMCDVHCSNTVQLVSHHQFPLARVRWRKIHTRFAVAKIAVLLQYIPSLICGEIKHAELDVDNNGIILL